MSVSSELQARMSPAFHLACARPRRSKPGQIDGFWANAMGAQNAITSGVGKVVLDVRRGIGPKAAFHYTMPVLVTSDRAIERDPEMVAAGVRAVVAAQLALKKDVSLATAVGRKLFPPAEAELIADVVASDLPYYTPTITDEALAGLVRFSQATGLLKGSPSREQMVATQFSHFGCRRLPGDRYAAAV